MSEDMTSIHAVFNLPELLETIFLNVDARTLLRIQRVSKTFKATLDHSPRLRRALWLEATPSNKLLAPSLDLNPLLSKSKKVRTMFGGGIKMKYDTQRQKRTAYAICGKHELLNIERRSEVDGWQHMLVAKTAEDTFVLDLWCFDGAGWAGAELECDRDITASGVLDMAAEQFKHAGFKGKFTDLVGSGMR